jgi:hypothetical protein
MRLTYKQTACQLTMNFGCKWNYLSLWETCQKDTWGRRCRVVLRSNRGYRDGNWFSGTKNYTIMYKKVDKSWFGFLSRPEIESQIYSHLLCTWWWYKKSRSGFQSFLWRPGMWIMATGFCNCNMVRNSCLSANGKVKRCAMKRSNSNMGITSATRLWDAPKLSLKDPIYPTSLGCVPLPIGYSKIESPVRKNQDQPPSSFGHTRDGYTYALWISQKSTWHYAQFYIVVQVFYKEQHTFMFYYITKKSNILC